MYIKPSLLDLADHLRNDYNLIKRDTMPRRKQCHLCKAPTIKSEGIQTPEKFFCSLEHATTYANSRLDRSRLDEKRKLIRTHKEAKRKAHKAAMEIKRLNIQWQHKVTQQAFNRMRVLEELLWFKERGLEPVCISCEQPLGNDQWACGHYKTRGGTNALRYDPKNTYLQHNHRCNMKMSGDIHGTQSTAGFRQGILNRFGDVNGQALLDYCEKDHQRYTWHWRELEEMRQKFNRKIKECYSALNPPLSS